MNLHRRIAAQLRDNSISDDGFERSLDLYSVDSHGHDVGQFTVEFEDAETGVEYSVRVTVSPPEPV